MIVGGGFGGSHAAHALRHAPVRVTVIDRTNHSVFHPLLYQVATAALSSDEIAAPIRTLLRRQRNADTLLAEVTRLDVTRRMVQIGARELAYDYLVLAAGSQYNYFGHDEWARYAPNLKTISDARRIRSRIIQTFEQAEQESDPNRIRALLTFVLVGGGPTGVEMAGALAELARCAIAPEYRHIDTRTARILLFEAGPRLLAAFPERLARKAHVELQRKGVEVYTDARVSAVDASGVVAAGRHVPSANVIWAAGVKATPLAAQLGVPTDRLGRVKVQPDLSIPGHPEVFVIGDLMVLEQDGNLFSPGLAPVAMQQGAYVGMRIARQLARQANTGPFVYRDKGNLATIGRGFAIADLGRLRFSGLLAWLLWGGVHLVYLTNLWNRVQVFATWLWAYMTFQRSVRVLTPDSLQSNIQVAPSEIHTEGMLHASQYLAPRDAGAGTTEHGDEVRAPVAIAPTNALPHGAPAQDSDHVAAVPTA
ncbi:MAG: NAD(P)/FAD-dependent oxidoreductase [Actinomycetota bacterium]|nr:NAD(P)/FAD-dependent oxidoreductase [Actinomycetota bacterium]